MKKHIYNTFLSALLLLVIISGCDQRKLDEQVLPAKSPKTMFITVDKDQDTIRRYSATPHGAFGLKIEAIDSEFPEINNIRVKTSIKVIEGAGTLKINNTDFPLVDTTLQVNIFHAMKYTPDDVAGSHKFVVTVDDGFGRIINDTVWFWVYTYAPVPFTVTLSKDQFEVVRPSGNFTFNVQITSSDLTSTMKYYIDYILPVTNAQASITRASASFPSGSQAAIGDNHLVVQLNGHNIGENYEIRFVIRDENGDFKRDTVYYNVRANVAPVINSITGTWSKGGCTPYLITPGNDQARCDIFLSLNISANDPNGLGPAGSISNYKVTINQTGQILNSTSANGISFKGGIIYYREGSGGFSQNYYDKTTYTYAVGSFITVSVQDDEGVWTDTQYAIPRATNLEMDSQAP